MLSEKNKLSIIIPVYNVEKYIRKCLESVTNQSYKNLEIIIVDDASTDSSIDVIKEFMKKDSRIKYVKHEQNKGLFQGRLTGSAEATGDYIAFLDSDDYVSIDYYRTLINNAINNQSDMVIGNTVLTYDDGRKEIFNLFDFKFKELNGEECIDEYFKQEGLCFSWHTVWNKIYSKKIWDKARKHYSEIKKHLVMTEDFAFSTVLFYYANKITKVDNDAIFYCKHEDTSTDVKKLNIQKYRKNIGDMILSFRFVENFMKDVGIYDKYLDKFNKWKSLYRQQQLSYIQWAKINKKEEKEALELINQFCNKDEEIKDGDYFSSIHTEWNDGLERIKEKICDENIKIISFDIFDTLIVRPFWAPKDMFRLLDSYFRDISKSDTGLKFYQIRIIGEKIARDNLCNEKAGHQEITLDEIYKTIREVYYIDKDVLEKVKKKEIEYELRFCTARKTGFELYELAKELGKEIVCTSDMYLSKEIISEILRKNNYNIEKIFISSEYRLSKSQGDLYKKVSEELKTEPKKILHIGDNYYSDVKIPTEDGYNAEHLKKAVDVFQENGLADVFLRDLPDWQDNISAMNFLGIRTMMAMAANRYFDNPYRSFNKESIFNGDSSLMGYYALGMHLYGVANWLIQDTKNDYDSVVFMARDGYLPMKAFELLKEIYPDSPETKYLYVSRKALIPASIINRVDLYKLSEVSNIENHTPRSVLKYIKGSLREDKDAEKVLKKHKIPMDEHFKSIIEFNKLMSIIDKELFDEEKNKIVLDKIKKYFKGFFDGKACVFDIGYSARPEMYISKLLGKSIDTYFININHEEAIEHSKISKFKLKTFFDYKPTFTGNMRELVLSKTAPSCIGYDTTGEVAKPVFEELTFGYKELLTINSMQEAALDLIRDLIRIFGKDISRLDFQNYYISLPHEMFIQSLTDVDKMALSCIYFEDDLNLKEHTNVVNILNNEMKIHNQHNIKSLINYTNEESIEEARDRLLKDRSKLVRLVYYTFFDRITLRRRFKEIFRKNKLIMFSGEKVYHLLRKIKRKLKKQ